MLIDGVRMRRRSTQPCGDAALGGAVDQAVAGEPGEARQRHVGGDGQEEDEALDPALARDVADAGVDRLGRGGEAGGAAGDGEGAAVVREEARERAGQLLAAGADDAGDAEDLAGVQREVDVAVGAGEARGPCASTSTSGR